jgi:hypothetical protein
MSSHSDEIWESFDALWRRTEQLGRRVKELEAKLGIEESATERGFRAEAEVSEKPGGIISYEGEIHR